MGIDRCDLALAFAVDTAITAGTVATVAVVTDDALVREAMSRRSIQVVSDGSAPGLNEAVRYAVAGLGRSPIAVLTADLPAMRAAELAEALRQGMAHPASFVADAEGTGTVLLMGRADRLRPGFGAESANRHRKAGFVELTGDWPGVRRDVDTVDNLLEAVALGVGPHTAKLLADTDGGLKVLSSNDHVSTLMREVRILDSCLTSREQWPLSTRIAWVVKSSATPVNAWHSVGRLSTSQGCGYCARANGSR